MRAGFAWVLVLMVVFAGCSLGGSSLTTVLDVTGTLDSDDDVHLDGQNYDAHEFRAEEGQVVSVRMTSDEFDTYIMVRSPNGRVWENDDWIGGTAESFISFIADKSGEWTALATSFDPGESGAYQLVVESGERVCDGTIQSETGELGGGDEQLESGEYVDTYEVRGRKGQTIVLDLRSEEFDPYLLVIAPNGDQFENDDFRGSFSHSHLTIVLEQSGTYEVGVTTFEPGEGGSYELEMDL